jgi:vacuolar-type H+-ATPase subunit I/STV1
MIHPMPSEPEIESLLAALEEQSRKLAAELSAIEDEERRDEIVATLSTIDQQKKNLEREREELRKGK